VRASAIKAAARSDSFIIGESLIKIEIGCGGSYYIAKIPPNKLKLPQNWWLSFAIRELSNESQIL
jgi:hypothetical protein